MRQGEHILGIDYGRRRVGLAIATTALPGPRPLKTLHVTGEQDAVAQVALALREAGAVAAVVGLPLHMDGTESPMATEARRFAQMLRDATGSPVELMEERWSSKEAERSLRGSGLRGIERKERIDSMAAQILLQTYLEQQSHRRRRQAEDDSAR
ncbi:MAG: Holliday junction resolvase RuvX [Planctomycetota bacterium]